MSGASNLTGIERPVIDRTGLTGVFSFDLRFAAGPAMGLRSDQTANLPSFETALAEQLGLRLEAAREVFDVLVVRAVRTPEPN
jgi:uncharacterized protein (TIGR03435 family)